MATDLKAATPDTTIAAGAFLFGADSQASASPSVYQVDTTLAAYFSSLLNGQATLSGATVTTTAPLLNHAQTWNAGAQTFTGWKLNVTDTASASASLLMDLQVGGVSRLAADKGAGALFTSALMKLGLADAASPVAQTIGVQNVVAGTSNTAGADFTIRGSASTGNAAPGQLKLQLGKYDGSSGTAQNAFYDALTISSSTASVNRTTLGLPDFSLVSFSTDLFFGSSYTLPRVGISSSGFVRVTSSGGYQWTNSTSSVNSTTVDLQLIRDAANTLALVNGTNAQTFNVYNTSTSSNANYERGVIKWSTNVLQIGTEAGGTGSTRNLQIIVGGTSRADYGVTTASVWTFSGTVSAQSLQGTAGVQTNRGGYFGFSDGGGNRSAITSSADGNLALSNFAQNSFSLLQFGGTTSSFPAIKRSTTSLQARLADDSAFTAIQGKLTTDTAYTATPPTCTGYITIYDSTGTPYKVMVST